MRPQDGGGGKAGSRYYKRRRCYSCPYKNKLDLIKAFTKKVNYIGQQSEYQKKLAIH